LTCVGEFQVDSIKSLSINNETLKLSLDEATNNHQATHICMNEIKNSQNASIGPNFVVNLLRLLFIAKNYSYNNILKGPIEP
jgi:hypothetical protein